MQLKETAFTWNVTTNGSSTPDWTQDIGQSKSYYMDYEGFNELCVGMLYYRVADFDNISAPLGKGGKRQSLANMDNYSLEIASIFDNIYVNGIHLDGHKFIMFVIKEQRETHHGRRQLKFSKEARYKEDNYNERCICAISKALKCGESGSWIVTDMDIKRESDSRPRLDFTAVVVSENTQKDFPSAEARSLYIKRKKGIYGVVDVVSLPKPKFNKPLQLIYFGAPGTSKSTTIKKEIGNCSQHRVTFHPDTDYSNFVGCYKPTKDTNGHDITYEFVAQTFVKAYIEAWKKLVYENEKDKRVFLIIEEINRGNCAQIFGDLFQLLDRDDNGYSDYEIEPDTDLQRYLAKEFDNCGKIPEHIANGDIMKLPPNLFIWATMNTSDQSLFPIDSAFKRRWEWKYLPIKNDEKGHIIRVDDTRAYDWWEFLNAVNNRIEKLTEQEDKQLGYWFAKPNTGVEISVDRFVSKVVFYLWNDVFKDFAKDANSPFVIKGADEKRHELKFNMFFDKYGNAIPEIVAIFIEGLKVMPVKVKEPLAEKSESEVSEETYTIPNDTNEPEQTDVEEEKEIAEYNETYESKVESEIDDDDPVMQTTQHDLFENDEQEVDVEEDDEEESGSGNADADNFLKALYNKKK